MNRQIESHTNLPKCGMYLTTGSRLPKGQLINHYLADLLIRHHTRDSLKLVNIYDKRSNSTFDKQLTEDANKPIVMNLSIGKFGDFQDLVHALKFSQELSCSHIMLSIDKTLDSDELELVSYLSKSTVVVLGVRNASAHEFVSDVVLDPSIPLALKKQILAQLKLSISTARRTQTPVDKIDKQLDIFEITTSFSKGVKSVVSHNDLASYVYHQFGMVIHSEEKFSIDSLKEAV
ncbi:hypothetical protein NB550_11180 [Vibrio parahaemolyticus]|uniref:hypothetical protein n=1 Tax=Vibrio TaxID=662 RepID=UPI00215BEBAD|nr:hypothetical protein [Vibrio parahaemolyticus]MCR9888122.1 hypothetical protein [Vibrio parahaemolyticus]MCR9918052.1 hypothetical protein [Vibrio parahaemolyticus]WHT06058.1 hypothetical protein O2T11_25760 [Vibrio parahaemolyticus]